MPDVMMFTTAEMVEAARREVGQRRRVYKRLVDNGKMSQPFADRQVAIMEAIALTLETMAKAERLL